jgi:hypothetical protein
MRVARARATDAISVMPGKVRGLCVCGCKRYTAVYNGEWRCRGTYQQKGKKKNTHIAPSRSSQFENLLNVVDDVDQAVEQLGQFIYQKKSWRVPQASGLALLAPQDSSIFPQDFDLLVPIRDPGIDPQDASHIASLVPRALDSPLALEASLTEVFRIARSLDQGLSLLIPHLARQRGSDLVREEESRRAAFIEEASVAERTRLLEQDVVVERKKRLRVESVCQEREETLVALTQRNRELEDEVVAERKKRLHWEGVCLEKRKAPPWWPMATA